MVPLSGYPKKMKYFNNIYTLRANVVTGLFNTFSIALIAILLGTVIGILFGMVLTYGKKWQGL